MCKCNNFFQKNHRFCLLLLYSHAILFIGCTSRCPHAILLYTYHIVINIPPFQDQKPQMSRTHSQAIIYTEPECLDREKKHTMLHPGAQLLQICAAVKRPGPSAQHPTTPRVVARNCRNVKPDPCSYCDDLLDSGLRRNDEHDRVTICAGKNNVVARIDRVPDTCKNP